MGKASRAKQEGRRERGSRPAGGGPDDGQAPPDGQPPPGGPEPTGLRVPRSLALLIVCAALFRAVYICLYARRSLFFDAMMLDSAVYDAWGQAIAAGRLIGTEAFYFPPLYPYLLGGLFRIAGHSYAVVDLVQGLLGLLNILLIHRVGWRLYGARAGLFAACGAALYAPFPFFETKLLATTLGLTLHLAALLAMMRAERRAAGGGPRAATFLPPGLALGAAALATPAAFLLALLYAARLARRSFACAGALLGGTALMLMPILAHNLYVAGDPLFLSAQGGITFYQGNNPTARGLYAPPPGFSGDPETQAREEKTIAEREEGRPLARSAISVGSPGTELEFAL